MPAGLGTLNNAQQVNWTETVLGQSISLPINFGAGVQLSVGVAGGAPNTYQTTISPTLSVVNPTAKIINLTSGTILQPDGTAAVFADVVSFAISSILTNTAAVTFGGGTGTVSWLPNAITLLPGQTWITTYPAANALAVTASSADKININAASGTQTVYLMINGH